VHDLSDGGLLNGLAEMALASGIGIEIDHDYFVSDYDRQWAARLFGEDQGRYLVSFDNDDAENIFAAAEAAGVRASFVGFTRGDALVEDDYFGDGKIKLNVRLADLRAAHEGFFPKLMGSELTPDI
jgi:phosphoribosylformylglycinamidine synthase